MIRDIGGSCLRKWTLNRVASPVRVNYDKGYVNIALLNLDKTSSQSHILCSLKYINHLILCF